MKSILLVAGVSLSLAFWHQTSVGIEVSGGTMVDVVVADSGSTDSTILTELAGGWLPKGPTSFDIDTSGGIYIMDQYGCKIIKYDKNGNFASVIPIKVETDSQIYCLLSDMAVDNNGGIHVVVRYRERSGKSSYFPDTLFNLSEDGKLLFKIPCSQLISTDKHGDLINYQGPINIYSPKGKHRATIEYSYGYTDIGIAQKVAGDDIFFRSNQNLMRTSLKDFLKTGKLDTAATLLQTIKPPDTPEIKFEMYGSKFVLLGYDNNKCFYFYHLRNIYNERMSPICLSHLIVKSRLEEGELLEVGTIEIDFQRGQDECSDKELFDFRKQFIIAGDGTIYFLHGTVDKIKVSKITIE